MISILDDLHRRVYALTCHYQGRNYGMIATWVSEASLSKEKRAVVVLSKFNDTTKVILKKRRFTLGVLSQNQTNELMLLGTQHSSQTDKFSKFSCAENLKYGSVMANLSSYAFANVLTITETPDRVILYLKLSDQVSSKRPPMILEKALKKLSRSQSQLMNRKLKADIRRDSKLIRTDSKPSSSK